MEDNEAVAELLDTEEYVPERGVVGVKFDLSRAVEEYVVLYSAVLTCVNQLLPRSAFGHTSQALQAFL